MPSLPPVSARSWSSSRMSKPFAGMAAASGRFRRHPRPVGGDRGVGPRHCARRSRGRYRPSPTVASASRMKPSEVKLCSHRSLSLAAFARWWVMRRYLRRSGADMGFFLCPTAQHALAFGLRTHGKPLAGICSTFRDTEPSVITGLASRRLRDVRKDLLYRMMLRTSGRGDDPVARPFSGARGRHYRHGGKVQALPIRRIRRPIRPPPWFRPTSCRRAVSPSCCSGYLTERKGPLMVLMRSVCCRRDRRPRRRAFAAASSCDPRGDRDPPRSAGPASSPSVVRIDDRRLSCRARQSRHTERSHPAPYQRFVGSSGVLLWAARAGRRCWRSRSVGRPADARHHLAWSLIRRTRQTCAEIARMVDVAANLHRSVVRRRLRVITHRRTDSHRRCWPAPATVSQLDIDSFISLPR